MSGRLGRSGRFTKEKENRITEVIELGFRTVEKFLGDESWPLDKRALLGAQFALKRIADKVEAQVNVSITHDIGRRLLALAESNRKRLESIDTTSPNPFDGNRLSK